MHVAEARDLVEQMIRIDAARSETWALRGVLAMNVYGDLAVAYESYESTLSRGGKATFRLAHDHGPDRPPCVGSLEIRTVDVEFRSDDGSHRFQQIVNRRADAVMMLRLVNRQRAAARR